MTLQDKKDELLEIAKKWYSGEALPEESVSDLQFDRMEKSILAEDPNWDYRIELDMQGNSRTHYYPMPKIKKRQETTKSMQEVFKEKLNTKGIYTLPKYDGGGLTLYYNEGILYDAITRSSQIAGKRQLAKVSDMVPRELDDKDIVALECEVICTLDKGRGDLSRQAATGLLNSNSLQERCEKELTIVVLKIRYKDGIKKNWADELQYLPHVALHGCNITFLPSPINEGKYEGNKFFSTNFSALIDGIVEYNDLTNEYMAHKLYFNEKKKVTMKKIFWGFTPTSLKWVPKYEFDTVKIDGTNVSCATAGGTAQLKAMKCGKGAEVYVIKSGLTIPQVMGLVEGDLGSEDYCLPTPCSCGTPLTWDDELNGGLYCSNTSCDKIIDVLQKQLDASGKSLDEILKYDPIKFIEAYMKVPRFGGKEKLKPGHTFNQFYESMIHTISPMHTIQSFFNMSGLQNDVMAKLDSVVLTFMDKNL